MRQVARNCSSPDEDWYEPVGRGNYSLGRCLTALGTLITPHRSIGQGAAGSVLKKTRANVTTLAEVSGCHRGCPCSARSGVSTATLYALKRRP